MRVIRLLPPPDSTHLAIHCSRQQQQQQQRLSVHLSCMSVFSKAHELENYPLLILRGDLLRFAVLCWWMIIMIIICISIFSAFSPLERREIGGVRSEAEKAISRAILLLRNRMILVLTQLWITTNLWTFILFHRMKYPCVVLAII